MAHPVVVAERHEYGFSWGLAGHGLLECRSHALQDDEGRVWLVDPLDGDGLDEEIAALGGSVAGVVVLLDRHLRSTVAVAARHDARILTPPGTWGRSVQRPEGAENYHARVDDCPFWFLPVVERQRQWIEYALWWEQAGVLVVAEALGTASYYRSRFDDPLAVHPVLRVIGPPRTLVGAAPGSELLLLGHGDAVRGDIATMVELAVQEGRRELPFYALSAPRHLVRWARAAVGMGRASC